MQYLIIVGVIVSLILFAPPCSTIAAKAYPSHYEELAELTDEDATLIVETYHVWETLGDKLWPGWTKTQIPLILVTKNYEYAVSFPKRLQEFKPIKLKLLPTKEIQVRERHFPVDSAAATQFEGINTIIIGQAKTLEKSSGEWVLTLIHEMFHTYQYNQSNYKEKIASLEISSQSDSSWQLNFPFPYKDEDVKRLIHLQSYPIFLAINGTDQDDIRYNTSVALEAIEVYRNLLTRQPSNEKAYNYSKFQEWQEGVARYTEYKIAESIVANNYQPTEAFRKLPDYKNYQQLWEDNYKNEIFVVKHAGRAVNDRTVFYYLGLSKGLLLDKLAPDWRNLYFTRDFWLDDLLKNNLSKNN